MLRLLASQSSTLTYTNRSVVLNRMVSRVVPVPALAETLVVATPVAHVTTAIVVSLLCLL